MPNLEQIAASLRARAENSRLRATVLREMADQCDRTAQALDRHADDLSPDAGMCACGQPLAVCMGVTHD